MAKKSKKYSIQNTSRNSACSVTTKLIEYSVSDIRYCQRHEKNSNETTCNDTVFGVIKRWLTCTSYRQLRSQDDVEDIMLMTVVECETHPELDSHCKTVKIQ